MGRFGPVVGLSFGLVLLTCSLVVSADLLGLLPKPENELLEKRIRLCETLAAQTTSAAARSDYGAIRAMLELSVEREPDLLSAGLREPGGRLLVVAGQHRKLWDGATAELSAASHVQVPLHRGQRPWATLEVRFADAKPLGPLVRLWSYPLVRLLSVVGFCGFFAYLIYLRRTLRHLDPSAVIPTRVQAALDVMAEGVVLLDPKERIVLANAAFAERVGRPAASLLGEEIGSLGFRRPDGDSACEGHPDWPWTEAIEGSHSATGMSLRLGKGSGAERALVANASPVLDGWGRSKGAIVTFDDVTELEEKTARLQETLALLEESREEIQTQNDELKVLARRDPLTGVANRRAFVDTYEEPVATSERGEDLCCIMADIDHFKRINDTHGHGTGDEVIRRVAETLAREVRSSDAVCRYGGEEFCIMLPGATIEKAAHVAERLRRAMESPGFTRVPISVSFGVASTSFGATRLLDLVNQADEALYVSKQQGRNRVTRWDQMPRTDEGASDTQV